MAICVLRHSLKDLPAKLFSLRQIARLLMPQSQSKGFRNCGHNDPDKWFMTGVQRMFILLKANAIRSKTSFQSP